MISVVVPVFRNEASIAELHRRLTTALPAEHELIFIDDASDDRSANEIRALMPDDGRVRLVSLEKNRGQQEAVLAGLRAARGEVVATMDADLQDPPEALPLLLARLDGSVDAVFAGRRGEYESAGRLRTSRIVKRLLGRITGLPADAGMCLVMKREIVRAILDAPRRSFYLPTAIAAVTRRITSIPVERARRTAGVSQYTWRGRIRLGIAALIGAVRRG